MAVLVGLVTGFLAGHFGIGGGLITTPAIRLLLGYPAYIAVGTPLVVNIPTALAGFYNYQRGGFIDYRLIWPLAAGGIGGAVAGSYITRFVSGDAILLITAGVIFVLAWRFALKPDLRLRERRLGRPALTAAGVLIGVFSGFLGLGGGFLLVPFLSLYIRKDIKTTFGTSLLVITIITIPGAMVHFFLGHVDLLLALLLIVGVIPGALLGSRVAIRLPESWLRVLFSILLMILAVYLGYTELILLAASA